jgi:multisubunit Na+/H+ antiporter MnhE subunit
MSGTDQGHPRGGGGARGVARAWLGWWLVLALLWLGLSDSRRPEEIAAALAVGALGAGAAVLVRAERPTLLRPPLRSVLAALPVLRPWPRELALLVRAIVRRPAGRVVEEPFRVGDGDDPRTAGRIALAVAAGSLTPNRVVIDVDRERGVIVSHVLVDDRPPRR